MALLKINGIHLNVNEAGQGQPLLLIHGIGGDSSQMEMIAEPLSKHFRVITLDCRGHGQSDKPTQFTLADLIVDILGIMDHFQLPTTYLLGVSMGSYISQGVAITAPERILKMVLTVPKSNGLTSSVQRLMKKNEVELKGLSFHEVILKLLKFMTYDTEAMKAHIDIFETTLDPEQFATANRALENFDFRNDLHKVTAKTLVISGKYDGLNPPEEGKICADLIPNARFVEMAYSGHAPMYEEPELYRKIVETFLYD
jgi:3-oxoadipate enol-lactonase